MRQHITDARLGWREQDAGDLPLVVDRDAHGLRIGVMLPEVEEVRCNSP
jgi:hypothetical protein